MEKKIFEFPALGDGLLAIEEKFCEVLHKYREGEIDPIEKDWMDWANNVLMAV